jgi:hypothetical protein
MPPAPCSLSPHCGGESEIEGLGERKPPKLQIFASEGISSVGTIITDPLTNKI